MRDRAHIREQLEKARAAALRAGWALVLLLAVAASGREALAAPAGPAGAPPPGAAERREEPPPIKKKKPIRITSDRMEAFNQKRLIIFIGNVSAVQGDLQIQSDRLEVYIKKQGKGGAKKNPAKGKAGEEDDTPVERIIAKGNVLLNQAKKKFAAGDHLDYNEATGIAILTGNPRAWEGNNQIVGTRIELYLKENRTVVYGTSRRRVNVTLFPEGAPSPSPPPGTRKKGSDGN